MGVTYDKNQDDVVLAREFYSDAEAHIAEAALNQDGIVCVIDNELFSRIYPIGNSSLATSIRLFRLSIHLTLKETDYGQET